MTTSYTKTLAPSRMNEIWFSFLRHTRNLHPLYTVIAFLHKQKCPDVLSFPLTPPTRNEENTTGSQGYGIVGNIWGKKLSQISRFYGYSQKFPPQNLGVWHHLAGPASHLRVFFTIQYTVLRTGAKLCPVISKFKPPCPTALSIGWELNCHFIPGELH